MSAFDPKQTISAFLQTLDVSTGKVASANARPTLSIVALTAFIYGRRTALGYVTAISISATMTPICG
jgi:hypothetical protein